FPKAAAARVAWCPPRVRWPRFCDACTVLQPSSSAAAGDAGDVGFDAFDGLRPPRQDPAPLKGGPAGGSRPPSRPGPPAAPAPAAPLAAAVGASLTTHLSVGRLLLFVVF